jgi:hypothetical protein
VTYIPSSDPDPTFLQNCIQCSETGTTFANTKPTGPKVLSITGYDQTTLTKSIEIGDTEGNDQQKSSDLFGIRPQAHMQIRTIQPNYTDPMPIRICKNGV